MVDHALRPGSPEWRRKQLLSSIHDGLPSWDYEEAKQVYNFQGHKYYNAPTDTSRGKVWIGFEVCDDGEYRQVNQAVAFLKGEKKMDLETQKKIEDLEFRTAQLEAGLAEAREEAVEAPPVIPPRKTVSASRNAQPGIVGGPPWNPYEKLTPTEIADKVVIGLENELLAMGVHDESHLTIGGLIRELNEHIRHFHNKEDFLTAKLWREARNVVSTPSLHIESILNGVDPEGKGRDGYLIKFRKRLARCKKHGWEPGCTTYPKVIAYLEERLAWHNNQVKTRMETLHEKHGYYNNQ